jgi:hypothetical protein
LQTAAFAHYEDPRYAAVTPHAVSTHSDHHHHSHDAFIPNAEASVYTTRISVSGGMRYVTADGLPDQPYGQFPNAGNPNVISQQSYRFQMPVNPTELPRSISEFPNLFGIALDGVPFDPGTAEFWNNDPNSGWHGEAMTAPPPRLGLDMNNAHVQPTGAYHYHGIPTSLYRRLPAHDGRTLVGWAADGYPVYVQPGSKPSYRLKSGYRPGGNSGPGGSYDGRYTEDWEYVSGLGDLDECNGRSGTTAEFPHGTYYYVLTDAYPFIPRRWHGKPDSSFMKGPPGGGRGGGPGRGPGGPRGPFGGPGGGFGGPGGPPPDGPPEFGGGAGGGRRPPPPPPFGDNEY